MNYFEYLTRYQENVEYSALPVSPLAPCPSVDSYQMDYEVEEMYKRLPELENEAKEKRREEEENERLVRDFNRRKQRIESIFIKYAILYYANDKIDAAEYTDLMDFVVERCLEKNMTEQKFIYELKSLCCLHPHRPAEPPGESVAVKNQNEKFFRLISD